jgi:tRNA nucleotidyltransferase (CCA-adding enzyme)
MSAAVVPAIPEEVREIARTLEDAGFEAWCVGGALRDALLGHPHSDYDFATSATPAQVTALFRRTAPVGEKYGTVGVLDRHRVLHEVTTFRRDVTSDGRHAVVAYGVSLDEDLARRDFTINAMAYHPL